MPSKQKARFKEGLWVKAEHVVYDRFESSMILKPKDLPKEFDYYTGGQDFGLHIATVKIGWIRGTGINTYRDTAHFIGDCGGFNITTRTLVEELQSKGWYDAVFPTYCDSAGCERIQEIPSGVKAQNSQCSQPRICCT